jgi:hypothetical protein
MPTWQAPLGHAVKTHDPDYMNYTHRNQMWFAARAIYGAFEQIPGLGNLGGMYRNEQSLDGTIGSRLETMNSVAGLRDWANPNKESYELGFRSGVRDLFLPEGSWDLRPEANDIPDARGFIAGTDPMSSRITYETTLAETRSFLRGRADPRSFVNDGIVATKIIVGEYIKRYHPNEPIPRWTISTSNRPGGVR